MRSPTWPAVLIWTRADLRRRWQSWAVLGLLAGVTVGLGAAGVAGARRTAVAVPNFERVARLPDAAILANNPAFDARQRAEVAALAEVRELSPFAIGFALNVVDPAALQTSTLLPTTPGAVQSLVGVLVQGRMPSATAPDEVVVDQNAQRRFGLDIGTTVVVAQSIPASQVGQLPPGVVPKNADLNYRVVLHVVGIAKSVTSDPSWIPSSAFYARYGPRTPSFVNAFAALRAGQSDIPRLTEDVSRIAGHPVNVESTQDLFGIRKAKDVTGIERQGLLLFALAVLIGGGVLVGQALVRSVTAGAADLPTWRAMGVDNATTVPTLVLPAALTAAVGAVVAVGTALALSPRFPLGVARIWDLDPGFHADWSVLAASVAVVVLGVLAIAALAAIWRTTRGASTSRPPAAAARRAIGAALPPALDVGFRLAVEPGRGRTAVPVRSALVGAIAGVLGVVGCLTFRAGLDAAVASPQRSGVVWNYIVASGDGPVAPADVATVTRDPNVGALVDAVWNRAVPVNGVGTPTFATRPLKATLPFVVLSGRAPTGIGEIAFAPITMKRLHLHVGDEVTVGRAAHVRVVGQVLLPATSHTDYDQSGWMTASALRAALAPTAAQGADDGEDYLLVRWTPGTDIAAAEQRLAAIGSPGTYYAQRGTRPTSVVDLGRLRTLPFALAIFFGLLASATVAHALVTTVRRRRRDLAVLRSLGFTRGQARIAIAWQATLLSLAGAVVGVPVGILVGQRSWRVLATNFPLAYATPVAVIAVVLAIPLALVLANVLAAGPAHAATRISPAGALRAE